jgi:tetratricopeptide (TPR) repeat protein
MKTKVRSVLFISFVLFANLFAQNNFKKEKNNTIGKTLTVIAPTVENETPLITEECLVNISLFNEFAKKKEFADAYIPWYAAYKACPNANKSIYTRGRDILQWKLSQSKDKFAYTFTFEQLMEMYDSRIKYIGNDQRYPTAWILGVKALDYITFSKADTLKNSAYGWLEQSIDGMGANSELEILRQFVVLSTSKYTKNKAHTEKYIADYLKSNDILEQKAKNTDSIKAKVSLQMKQSLDFLFAQSGVANCKTLDDIYQEKLKSNFANLEYLTTVCSLYKGIHCTDSEVFFLATIAAHKIQPTAQSANACAEMSYRKKEFAKAIGFYEEATKLSTNSIDKADFQYKIGQIYYSELDNYQKAREFARNSLEFNPKCGSPYILIGIMYAKSKGIYDNPVLAKTVYWVAVDKFIKAKQVDPSSAADAEKLIRTYSSYFPSKDDIFFQPDLQAGKSFFVGGWIGESTICR